MHVMSIRVSTRFRPCFRVIFNACSILCRSVDAIPLGIPGVPAAVALDAAMLRQSDREKEDVMSAGGSNWNIPRRVSSGGMQRQVLLGALVLGALYCTQAWEGAVPPSSRCSKSAQRGVGCIAIDFRSTLVKNIVYS
jgi:hypothetical protein